MKRKRIIIYSVYAALFFAVKFCMELVKNHRIGYYVDYDLYIVWNLFPVMLFCHGVISYFITKGYSLYYPFGITAILIILQRTLNDFIDESVSFKAILLSLESCLVLMAFGLFLSLVVGVLIKTVKNIKKR